MFLKMDLDLFGGEVDKSSGGGVYSPGVGIIPRVLEPGSGARI